jgi:hypothetical protein
MVSLGRYSVYCFVYRRPSYLTMPLMYRSTMRVAQYVTSSVKVWCMATHTTLGGSAERQPGRSKGGEQK